MSYSKNIEEKMRRVVVEAGSPLFISGSYNWGRTQTVTIEWAGWFHATKYYLPYKDQLLEDLAEERLINWVLNKISLGIIPEEFDKDQQDKYREKHCNE